MTGGRLVGVNAGRVAPAAWAGRPRRTAIDKRPIAGAVEVGPAGLAGDEQADRVHHGGADQAVYAYAEEDALFWADQLGRSVPPGSFGENLTTFGVDVSGAVVGERWRVGSVLLQVTSPRIPCQTFAGFWDVPDLIRRFTEAGRTGAYLRVLAPGAVRAGEPVSVVGRPDHGITVRDLLRLRTGDRARLLEVARVAELPPAWRSWVDSVGDVKSAR